MPVPKNTAKTTQPKTPAPTNIFCFDDDDDDDNDDNVDDDGLGESGSATERWLPFEVGKWVVFAVGVNVVDSEIKIILVSGAKNMGSRKSETTLEQPSAMRSSEVNLQSTASWMYNITGPGVPIENCILYKHLRANVCKNRATGGHGQKLIFAHFSVIHTY